MVAAGKAAPLMRRKADARAIARQRPQHAADANQCPCHAVFSTFRAFAYVAPCFSGAFVLCYCFVGNFFGRFCPQPRRQKPAKTLNAAYPAAAANSPACRSRMISLQRVEKVVKAPKSPVGGTQSTSACRDRMLPASHSKKASAKTPSRFGRRVLSTRKPPHPPGGGVFTAKRSQAPQGRRRHKEDFAHG